MMLTHGIMTECRCNKIRRDQKRSLVQQLIKSMLSVCTRFPPDHGPRMISYSLAVSINMLSVTFHISLLKISGKTMHVLIIRKNRFCLCTKKINVPETDQSHQNRNVFFKSFFPK